MYVLISKLFRRRLFIKYHGSFSYLLLTKSLIWKTLTRICVNLSSGIGVLSREEKENFVRAGYPGGHFFVVPNSIDCQRFAGAVKKKALMKDILFISRFLPSKGLIDAIRAVKIVLDSGKTVRLVCVGDGPQMQEAQSLVNELRIQQHVKFEGFLSEDKTTAYYLNSDMLVFPTTHGEGFSMVIFQSVASGLPIITTRIRAAADYLKEPDNCIWTKPGNPEMLAQKICYILDQPEIALKMADNNRKLAQRFSPDKVALEYLKLYNHLLRN
jgi:glycosyltransferase involved in cell wall biosynthesis